MRLWKWGKKAAPAPAQLAGDDTVDGRCLQQWVAGALGQVQESESHLRLGASNFTRTWLVTGYPEGQARLGRLNRLLKFHLGDPAGSQVHVRVSHYLVPSSLPDSLRTRWLRNRQRGMANETAMQGTPDADTTQGLKAYSDIYQAVAFQEDRVFELWIAITITAPDADTLSRMEQKLLGEVSTLNMAVTPLFKQQVEGLGFSHVLGVRQAQLLKEWPGRLSHTLPLSYLFPFMHGSISEGTGVYVGHEIDDLGLQHAANIDFTRGTGPMNWVIAGKAGEGKTTAVKGLNLGLLLEGFQITQYDANGEYREFTDFVGGAHVDMTLAGGQYFEPLVIPPAVGDAAYDLARFTRTCQLFHCVLRGLVPDLSPAEQDLADKLLLMTWRSAGVDRDQPSTWNRHASIHDWYGLLAQYPNEELAGGLQAKLSMFFTGTLQIFRKADDTNYWADAPFVRVAIDGVTNDAMDERVAAVKMLLVTHRVWGSIVANKHQGLRYAMVNVDEGQRVLRIPDMAQHVYTLATDGRKFNAGLSVCANDVSVFSETQGGRGLWENASLRMLFYMADSGLHRAAGDSFIPEAVIDQVRQLNGTHEYMMTRDLRRWTRARMELPDLELYLARTRGLRTQGAS